MAVDAPSASVLNTPVNRNSMPRILVVDDEVGIREGLQALLAQTGAWVETASNLLEAYRRQEHHPFDLVFLDLRLSGEDGLSGLDRLRSGPTPPEVVLLTGHGTIQDAVEAMRKGACDVIEKPFEPAHLLAVTERCLETRRLRVRVSRLQGRVRELTSTELVGQSAEIRELLDRALQVAKAPDTTILIQGESGTGKELVARCIHERSSRADGPFVAVNCAALTESLLEAELFGYEAGAFTGASREGKDGLFAAAENGTLLLDEIGEMPLNLQVKLLRVLQEKSYRRVGGVKDRPARVRIVAATNRKLGEEVAAGRFREDLYYRLHVITLEVPPLRERVDDVPLLAHNFLDLFGRQMGKSLTGFSEDAMETLCEHTWPGNVRELRNAIEHAAILCPGGLIEEAYLPRWDGGLPGGTDMIPRDSFAVPDGERSLRAIEKRLVDLVLEETNWNISRAASILGINRTTLYNKIKLHDLGSRRAHGRGRVPV
ncbi:MAG: sigma-54-dependent Fis family transcriptional regulator [Planctomycetes bacterium]|nr:sigma-54-dependent Fis family transcriptional regulator [Planctomycetota bacterium]MCB9920469.1 sigma-54-dependent Fis family transcriptional regulator [Planctomycetota bacterium]